MKRLIELQSSLDKLGERRNQLLSELFCLEHTTERALSWLEATDSTEKIPRVVEYLEELKAREEELRAEVSGLIDKEKETLDLLRNILVDPQLSRPIEDMGFSPRLTNTLTRRAGMRVLGDILQFKNWKNIRGIGKKSKAELIKKMAELGYSDFVI